MKLFSAASCYRMPCEAEVCIEDTSFINARGSIFGVADGVSEAYSPRHPPIRYRGDITGGQMVATTFAKVGASVCLGTSAQDFLKEVNESVLQEHKVVGRDPVLGDDVGGASFAVCKVDDEGITFVLGGDCFVFVESETERHFFSGFDEFAFAVEQQDNAGYDRYLKQAGGRRGDAWDLYWPEYRAKRLRTSNRNLGNGGIATLNGDPSLSDCWTVRHVGWKDRPRIILLGTDGLLPSQKTDPKRHDELANEIGNLYEGGSGVQSLWKWRDEIEDSLLHVVGWPEASVIELRFGE